MTYQPPSLVLTNWILAMDSSFLDLFADVDPDYGRMIFRDALPVEIVGRGSRAVLIRSAPGENNLQHVMDATVSVSIYCDHTRVDGVAVVEDGIDRAYEVYGHLDHYLTVHGAPKFIDGTNLQISRLSHPLESHDRDQDCPYLVGTYDVTINQQR